MNDYPAQPPRAEMNDAHRVYPGDGVARVGRDLADAARQWLSLCLVARTLQP